MKELYLANSVQELVKIAEGNVPDIIQSTKLGMYLRSAEQMIMQVLLCDLWLNLLILLLVKHLQA